MFRRITSYLILSSLFYSAAFAAKQGDIDCQRALTSWQVFRQTQLSLNYSAQVQSEDQQAMTALIKQGFVVVGSWRFENTRKENKQRLHSLIEVAQRGFRHEVDNRYLFRILSSEALGIEEAQNSGGPRVYLLIGDHLYSVQADMNHPILAGLRGFERERAHELALTRQLGQPAFRSAGFVGQSQSLMPLSLGSGLDGIMRHQIQQLIENPTEDARGLDLQKLLDFAIDPRIFEYRHFKGGKFTMGSTKKTDPDRWDDEGPQREIELSPFDMGNHIPQWMIVAWRLITNRLWEGSDLLLPYFHKKEHSDGDFIDLGTSRDHRITLNGNHPAERVSYNEAIAFLDWLNNLPAIKTSGCRYNLASQAQWEYAARYLGPENMSYDSRPFPESRLGDYAYYGPNSGERTHATGRKQAHPNGLLDMFGNAWVWTLDGWSNDLRALPRERDPVVLEGSYRVIRGGSWYYFARYLRSARRNFAHPGRRSYNVGFRFVRYRQSIRVQRFTTKEREP